MSPQCASRFLLFSLVCFIRTAISGETARVSVDSLGGEGDGNSFSARISADGQFVTFYSHATDLVPGDVNGVADVFVHDRVAGTTEMVSVDPSGNPGNQESILPSISANGRYVAFLSSADSLVPGDTNNLADIFVRDLWLGLTYRASISSSGEQANGDSCCRAPSLSDDGRYVAFNCVANNLVMGDTNGHGDVFVHDRETGRTVRASVNSAGVEGDLDSGSPHLSANGQFVAFASDARNLVPSDTNLAEDVFVHDLVTGETVLVSVDSAGGQGNGQSFRPSVAADGQVVAFVSDANNLVAGDTNGDTDAFVHDRTNGQTERVSVSSSGTQANEDSQQPWISPDARWVTFNSIATNLVPGDTNAGADVFRRDRSDGTTMRVSVKSDGAEAEGGSGDAMMTPDGRYVCFASHASDLVSGDGNTAADAFVRDTCVDAAWVNYGSGWPGTFGVPALTSNAVPRLCEMITLQLGNSLGAPTEAVLFLGILPASLATAWDGTLLVLPMSAIPIALPASGVDLPVIIPCDRALCGVSIYLQALEIDGGASRGVSFTQGLNLVVGL